MESASARRSVLPLSVPATRRAVLGGFGLAAGSALLAACSGSLGAGGSPASSGGAGGGGGLKVAVIPKATTDPYFVFAKSGAEKATKDLGDQLIFTGSADKDPSHQVAAIQSVLAQQPDVLVVAALDTNAVAPVLRQARKRGVTVVTWDSDSLEDARDVFVNQLTYELAAQTYLDAALLDDPAGGKAVFMAATPSSTNQVAQIAAMTKLMQSNPKYQVLKPGKTYYVNDDATQSSTTMTNIMQADPSVKFMLSGSANSVPAAAQAIRAAGKKGSVFSTGAALPSSIESYVKDGTGKAFALWNPADLAYLAVTVAHQVHQKTLKVESGAEFTAGTLGSFSVAEGNTVYLNKPLIFTEDNVGRYDF